MDAKTLKAVGKCLIQFDNIASFMEEQEFWCNVCDCAKVNSEKPETGKFFQGGGCIRTFGPNKGNTGDWEHFIFAICSDCLNKD
jgi:hypothetical protein